MLSIKINDSSFYPDPSSSKYHSPKMFEWDRIGEQPKENELIFFTDGCLRMSEMALYDKAFKVAFLIEPPCILGDTYNYIRENHNRFNLILTHQLDFIKELNIEKCIWYPNHMSWVDKKDWRVYEKPKNISIIASNKNFVEGHILRHKLIKSYDINNRPFDVYGSCTGQLLEHKIDALRDYKFTVVVENCKLNGYYSEKITDALCTYTIPIYWGCPNIGDYFNTDGMVICSSLEEIKDAITYINSNPEKAYEIGKPYLEDNFNRATKFSSPEDYIYENILLPRKLVPND